MSVECWDAWPNTWYAWIEHDWFWGNWRTDLNEGNVDATKAENKADFLGMNIGRQLDGDRVEPNGDDKELTF